MNFNAHAVAGIAAGIGMVTLSQITGFTSAGPGEFNEWIKAPWEIDSDTAKILHLFVITVFMSLFPDLDSASVVQRWFFRFVIVMLICLLLTHQMGLFAAVSFTALLPLLHRHRGWTHSKITPFALSALFLIVQEWIRATDYWFGKFEVGNLTGFISVYWAYIAACVLGHYTHLLLDGSLFD